MDRRPHSCGSLLTDQQEWAVVKMGRVRNDIQLSEIKQAIEENDDTFAKVASISLPAITCRLKRHQVSMKHIYTTTLTTQTISHALFTIHRRPADHQQSYNLHYEVPCKSIHPPWRFSYFVAIQPVI